jgi:hypothetical protein
MSTNFYVEIKGSRTAAMPMPLLRLAPERWYLDILMTPIFQTLRFFYFRLTFTG